MCTIGLSIEPGLVCKAGASRMFVCDTGEIMRIGRQFFSAEVVGVQQERCSPVPMARFASMLLLIVMFWPCYRSDRVEVDRRYRGLAVTGADRPSSPSAERIASVVGSRITMQSTKGQVPSGSGRDIFTAGRVTGVLLDWNTGRVLKAKGEGRAATPGSLLKPLVLAYGLHRGLVDANTRVYCRRTLKVADRSLACTHPDDQPLLDAEGALAASCNTWFASLALRLSPQDLQEAFQQAGLPTPSVRLNDSDSRILAVLGLTNDSVTPLQVARAYRKLLLRESPTGVVWKGLRGSVAYGMANNARLNGVDVLGKTGTARNGNEWWSHGWFAGAIPGRFVLVVYVPRGDGGVAATTAGRMMREMLSGGGR